MPGLQLVIDPVEAPLALSEENGFNLFSPLKCAAAQAEIQWASNADSDGELPAGSRDQNTQITPRLRMTGATEKVFRQRQVKLEQKINKLREEEGTLRIVYPDGSWIDWEIRGVTGGERLLDNRFVASLRTEDELTFICAPFGKGEEKLVGEFEGEAKRLLECVVSGVGGSAPALGRAVITSPESDVWELAWGKESRRFSESPKAKCLYAASALTPLGGASVTTATVDGKAGTSVVRQGTLTPNWTAVLSTLISGVGPMIHEGVLEVVAWLHMPATNSGEVGIGFEYGVGDMVHTIPLDPTYFPVDHPREGKVIKLVLGQAFLAAVGIDHRWEGRIVARSTVAGDVLDVLDFALRPLTEGNGRIRISPTLNQPAALLTRDEFNQPTGGLNGKAIAAAAAIAGPNSPATVANDASAPFSPVAWTNPSNAKTADGSYATLTVTSTAKNSQYLKATNLGFAIPEAATVSGFVVKAKVMSSHGKDENHSTLDEIIGSVKGGVIKTSLAKAGKYFGVNWSTSGEVREWGSETDLWEQTWTPADINSANFGFVMAVRVLDGTGTTTASVDYITITVYYTLGQIWATTGDAVDMAVEEVGHTAKRTEVSDADINTGRYAIAGTTVTSDVVVGIKAMRSGITVAAGERVRGGSLAREIDTNNWLFFGVDTEAPSLPTNETVRVVKRVAGVVTELARLSIPTGYGVWRAVWLQVDRRGRYFCWGSLIEGGIPRLLLAGQDNDLKEGGVLDDGKNGFYDAKTGANANTRNYDQFVVWIPPLDAAIYQGLSLELTDKACRREVQSGGAWSDITPQGDYLKLAPAGMEGRKNRLVFMASPHDPDLMGVGFPTKLKVAIYATPRYRTVPDPA